MAYSAPECPFKPYSINQVSHDSKDGDDEDNGVVDSDDRNDSDGVTYGCDGAS